MKRRALHERDNVFTAHRDDYLFSQWSFGGHPDTWLSFVLAIDEIVNLIDFLCALRDGNVSLIFKMSNVLIDVLEA